jgi:inorganic pyrophosphatase/exopolyphosphatase
VSRTRCWDCMFCDKTTDHCAISDEYALNDETCEATDEQLASAAAQIAALQHERAIERLPKQQKAMGRAHAAEAFGGEVEAE